MEAYEAYQNYIKTLDTLNEEDMKKLIEQGGMTPALLVDIGRSLAILADNVASVSKELQGIKDEIHRHLLWS